MSTSVNAPTNTKQRDRDVDNKLRLYGIYNAFLNGKLPSNKQIDVALSSLINHKKIQNPNNELSAEGRVVLEDFRNVVEEAKRLLLIKNHDQALQEFIWNATQLGRKGVPVGTSGEPVDRDTANRDVQKGSEGLKTLGQLIITNGQFRKLLNDAVILLRDIAGDVATKAASYVSPSEEQLRQIDDPAANHEWREAPKISKDNLKQQFHDRVHRNKPIDRGELRDVASNGTAATDPYGSRDSRDTVEHAAYEQRQGAQPSIDARNGIGSGVGGLQQRVGEYIPEDQKQKGRKYRERSMDYLQGKMPQERREQTIWRLKRIVIEVQGHRDYSEAIDTLLNLAETYTGHGKTIAFQSAENVKDAHQDNYLQGAEHSLKVVLERFANNTSAEDLVEAINDIYHDADRDPELKNWFRGVDRYVRRCLQQEGYIMEDESTHEYNQLYDQGNFLLRNRYRNHTDRLMDEAKFLGDQYTVDPDNKRFGDAVQKLSKDLGNDENGKPVFKKHLVKDITQVILPGMLESIRYVPVPRVEYSDSAFDAVIENLVLESDNLMPNVLEIGNDSYFKFGRKSVSSKRRQQIMVSASQIQCDLRDVSYYVNRKQGFPTITDTGVADIFLGGDGFGFKLQLSTAEKHERARFFKVEKIDVTIKHLSIKLKQSKHKALFGIFKPLLLKVMKPIIIKIIKQEIRKTFGDFDSFCYRVHQEEQKIKNELKINSDPDNVQNIYNRYYQAFQKELIALKERAEAIASNKRTKMAVTAEDSMFKDIKLPGGISTRATEFRNQAAEGDRWENDIFSIGSASPTTGIPQSAQVTRKSPHARRRRVKDRETSGSHSRDSGYQGHEGISGYGTMPITTAAYGNTPSAAYGDTSAPITATHVYEGYSTSTNPVSLNKSEQDPYERYTPTKPTPYGIV